MQENKILFLFCVSSIKIPIIVCFLFATWKLIYFLDKCGFVFGLNSMFSKPILPIKTIFYLTT